jgi:hypothetical protein
VSGVAKFVKKLDGWQGDARLYRLVPPVPIVTWNDEPNGAAEYVAVSANVVMFSGAETYIFHADPDGEVISWSDLPGSFRGGLDHERALRQAGYVLAEKLS